MSLATPCPVLILLATYNGAAYLREQIESIQRQTFSDWRLLIRDDGSTDATRDIVHQYIAGDSRIELLCDTRGRLGLLKNFATLAEAALERSAHYIAFADQDDVCQTKKLAIQLDAMKTAERDAPPETSIAVHSDLAVVDGQLRPIHPSFLRYQGLWHEEDRPLRTLVVQNFVTGCTLLCNRPLLELAVPMPPEALVHDWWLALCAAAAGRLEFVPSATVLYRQHGRNAIGAKPWWSPRVWPRLRQIASRGKSLRDALRQAAALQRRLLEQSPDTHCSAFLDGFCTGIRCASGWRRIQTVRQLSIRRQGAMRNAVLWAQLCVAGESARQGV
jgi:glycosyltransferase involved in cell wall biosynthesis